MAKLKMLETTEAVERDATPEVLTQLQDPLTLATDARLLAERIDARGSSLKRYCQGIHATTEGEVARLTPSAFPLAIQIRDLEHEAEMLASLLLNFEDAYSEGQALYSSGRQQLGLELPKSANPIIDLDLGRQRQQRLGTVKLALLELTDALTKWQAYMLVFRVSALRHVQAAVITIKALDHTEYTQQKAALKAQDDALEQRYATKRAEHPCQAVCRRLGVSYS
jgi:hypothetical protein